MIEKDSRVSQFSGYLNVYSFYPFIMLQYSATHSWAPLKERLAGDKR